MNYPLGKKFFQLILNLAYLATIIVRIFPPETSHDLTLKSLKIIDSIGFRLRGKNSKKTNLSLMGLSFKNKLGVSGGLDKNGDYITALSNLGFGFVELGTVTPRPQVGNNKPRLFRDSKNQKSQITFQRREFEPGHPYNPPLCWGPRCQWY